MKDEGDLNDLKIISKINDIMDFQVEMDLLNNGD